MDDIDLAQRLRYRSSMANFKTNSELFERAQKVIPGGVNSPVRAFKSVGGTPLFIRKAEGARVTDVEGKTYIDLVGSWGPLILGHTHEAVLQAMIHAARQGSSFGAPTESEIFLAEKICSLVPSIEKVRLVNSGTEATMSAIRLARGYTKREKIIKFAGCYHGHADCLLVQAGSGASTLGIADSAGVTQGTIKDTIVLAYNDESAVEKCFAKQGKDIAALILEPVAGNMGCIPPKNGYLECLREITSKHQSLLIFDEVMTGFRLGLGGAQERYSMKPDLTCLGKIIGGGLPVGAYGGRQEIMDHVAPLGDVYQAGTLSGNPLAVAAGLATLEILSAPGTFEKLEDNSNYFQQRMRAEMEKINLPMTLNQVGSMFTLFFHPGPVENYAAAKKTNSKLFAKFFHSMLAEGIYLPPSAFESAFISLAHSREDLDCVVSATAKVLKNF